MNKEVPTTYTVSHEPLLFYMARTYGVESPEFVAAVDSADVHDHAQTIKNAVESPHLREADAPHALAAIDALTAIVRARADAAEATANSRPAVDSLA